MVLCDTFAELPGVLDTWRGCSLVTFISSHHFAWRQRRGTSSGPSAKFGSYEDMSFCRTLHSRVGMYCNLQCLSGQIYLCNAVFWLYAKSPVYVCSAIHLVTFHTPHQFPLSQPESSLTTRIDGAPRIESDKSSTASLTSDSSSVSSNR